MHDHTSTKVCIHATLERSDSALKLKGARNVNTSNGAQACGACTPNFCAIPHLEREAAGTNVGAVWYHDAVFKVIHGPVLRFRSTNREILKQSQ